MNDANPLKGLLRAVGILLFMDVIALMLGGAFFLIVHGTAMGLWRLAPYWHPAHQISSRIFGDSPMFNAPVTGAHRVRVIRSIGLMRSWLALAHGYLFETVSAGKISFAHELSLRRKK
jgi:hypothetical protein